MSIDLYYLSVSPPCRAVMMTAYMAGVDVNLKLINMLNGDHMKPEFLQLNPQHNIPFMVDGDLLMNESRAISAYLINQYGQKVKHLYPEDPQERAAIDELLYFDQSVLFINFRDLYVPVFMGGAKQLDPETLKRYHEGLGFFDTRLGRHDYAAGPHLTIADLALSATIASVDAVDNRMLDKYPKIQAWFKRCQKEIVHYDELNRKGAKLHGQLVQTAMKKNGIE